MKFIVEIIFSHYSACTNFLRYKQKNTILSTVSSIYMLNYVKKTIQASYVYSVDQADGKTP